jgi:hypothetical protein
MFQSLMGRVMARGAESLRSRRARCPSTIGLAGGRRARRRSGARGPRRRCARQHPLSVPTFGSTWSTSSAAPSAGRRARRAEGPRLSDRRRGIATTFGWVSLAIPEPFRPHVAVSGARPRGRADRRPRSGLQPGVGRRPRARRLRHPARRGLPVPPRRAQAAWRPGVTLALLHVEYIEKVSSQT